MERELSVKELLNMQLRKLISEADQYNHLMVASRTDTKRGYYEKKFRAIQHKIFKTAGMIEALNRAKGDKDESDS